MKLVVIPLLFITLFAGACSQSDKKCNNLRDVGFRAKFFPSVISNPIFQIDGCGGGYILDDASVKLFAPLQEYTIKYGSGVIYIGRLSGKIVSRNHGIDKVVHVVSYGSVKIYKKERIVTDDFARRRLRQIEESDR